MTRILVGGYPGLDEGAELTRHHAATLDEDDGGADLLAQGFVWQADDCAFLHRRMLIEHLLHLAGVHIEPATDDEIFLAVDDVVVALRVGSCHVSRLEPTVHERRRSL